MFLNLTCHGAATIIGILYQAKFSKQARRKDDGEGLNDGNAKRAKRLSVPDFPNAPPVDPAVAAEPDDFEDDTDDRSADIDNSNEDSDDEMEWATEASDSGCGNITPQEKNIW